MCPWIGNLLIPASCFYYSNGNKNVLVIPCLNWTSWWIALCSTHSHWKDPCQDWCKMPLGYVTMLSRVLRVSKFRNPIKQISSLDLNPRSTPCTQCNPSGWKGPSPGKAQSLRLAHSDLAPPLQFHSIGHQAQKPQSLLGVGIRRRSSNKSIVTWDFKLDGLGNWAPVVVFLGLLSVFRFRNWEWLLLTLCIRGGW